MTIHTHRPLSWSSVLLLIGGAGGLALGLPASLGVGVIALVELARGRPEVATQSAFIAAALLTASAFGVPLVWFGLRGLSGNVTGGGIPSRRAWLAIFFVPPALFAGYLAFKNDVLPWLIGPMTHVLAAAIPVLLLVLLARRWNAPASPRRAWSQFGAGFWGAPAILLPAELALLIVGILLLVLIVAVWPGGLDLIRSLPDFKDLPNDLAQIEKLLLHPAVVAAVFLGLSLVIPLVEELVKPLGTYLILWKRPSAAQSFLSGALSGAGYALFEALFNNNGGPEWASTAFVRIGATAMHMMATGLVSWGLGEAFVRRKPFRLLGAYALAVALHGTWNGLAVGAGYAALLRETLGGANWPWTALIGVGGAGLVALTGIAIGGIAVISRRLAGAGGIKKGADAGSPSTENETAVTLPPPDAAEVSPDSTAPADGRESAPGIPSTHESETEEPR